MPQNPFLRGSNLLGSLALHAAPKLPTLYSSRDCITHNWTIQMWRTRVDIIIYCQGPYLIYNFNPIFEDRTNTWRCLGVPQRI